MSALKKIKANDPFIVAAALIIKARYKFLKKMILIYLDIPNVENLHKMRIAVRRFRYSLENFKICFKKRDYDVLIAILRQLQDLIGEGRDLDVFREKLINLKTENDCDIPPSLPEILDEKKVAITTEIIKLLQYFMENQEIRKIIVRMK